MKRTGLPADFKHRTGALLCCAAIVLGLLLGGCGQRGPLFLPDRPAAAEEVRAPDPAKPADSDEQQPNEKDDEKTP